MKINFRLSRVIVVGFRFCRKKNVSFINPITYKTYKYLKNQAKKGEDFIIL